MNANELADAMQSVISVLNVHHEEDCLFIANDAQYMLRQQQAEIAELKHMNRNWQISENILLLELEALKAENSHLKYEISSGAWNTAKELTDEEIEEIVKDCIEDDYNMISNPYLVARAVQEAILRKEQE